MIGRYSRKTMTALWSDDHRFSIWLEIECLVCEAQAELGLIPQKDATKIRKNAQFNIERIHEIEKDIHHDVLAFLTSVSESLGEESRFVHRGLTSSDIVDSCFGVQLTKAADILLEDIDTLCAAFKKKAEQHKDTIMIGRSHGMHGEPITFGFKMAQAYAEFERWRNRLAGARTEIAVIALSGPMGNFAHLSPDIERMVAKKMNMAWEPLSTQIIPRDRHAFYFSILAGIASSIERVATEIRHLQRSELNEAMESFGEKQKGSSAMPHKRNPVLSENLTGLARVVRSHVIPALENIALWHERDISHSSVERIIAPDATITLDFALHRLTHIIDNLVVNKKAMRENMDSSQGLWASSMILLALTDAGMKREEAYRLVQHCAFEAHEKQKDFAEVACADKTMRQYLKEETLKEKFAPAFYLRHMDEIFKRIFEQKSSRKSIS